MKRAWKRYRTYRGRTRESIAPGCPEKLDLEFVFWILWQGRTPRRLARFRKTVKQYQDKTVVLKNQASAEWLYGTGEERKDAAGAGIKVAAYFITSDKKGRLLCGRRPDVFSFSGYPGREASPRRCDRCEADGGLFPKGGRIRKSLYSRLHRRIFMGKAQIGNGVQTVKLFSPAFRQLLAVVDGLSAAAGAAAGTGHHFHKVILHFAPAQSLDQPPGVAQAADYGHPNGGVGNVEGGFLPAVPYPAHPEGIGGRFLPVTR